jgi:predicted Zn-dependent peptidase
VRENATAEALLPLLLERCYAGCPDMTLLSRRLAELYGASLSVDSVINGGNRVLSVSVCGIKDSFALQGEELSRAYADIAFGTAFTPCMVDGVLDPAAIAIEKEQLRELILSEMNEKRVYCIRQARRKFFGDTPSGIERYGYLSELDELTPQQVTQAFENMVRTAQIEVMCLGAQPQLVSQSLQQALCGVQRAPVNAAGPQIMPVRPAQSFVQAMPTEQGKLCLLFTGGASLPPNRLTAARVAVALLGGTATSRLFVNVREKRSLCYYCAASYTAVNDLLTIDSGVEHCNAEAAQQAILAELEALCTGPITEKELDDTKRSLKNQLAAVGDSLQALEGWYLAEIMRGTMDTPQAVSAQVDAVTAEDVRAILQRFALSVSYVLTKGESGNG